jgi:hypothetical protein
MSTSLTGTALLDIMDIPALYKTESIRALAGRAPHTHTRIAYDPTCRGSLSEKQTPLMWRVVSFSLRRSEISVTRWTI